MDGRYGVSLVLLILNHQKSLIQRHTRHHFPGVWGM